MPGADRVAWRLGAKTRVPALGAAVGLCLCPSKGLPAGMDPYCSSGVPRALHSGWLHSGAATSKHLDPAASETQHQTAGHAVLCRVRCRDEAVLDLRLNTMKRLMAHWVLYACAKVEENTSITTKAWRHLSWTFEEAPRLAARATREHLDGHSSMRRRWNKRSHRRKRTSSSMTTTMAMLRIPRARRQLLQKDLQLLQKHLSRFRQFCRSRTRRTLLVSALRVRQASTKAMNFFQARCRTEGAPASCRRCDDAPGSGLSPEATTLVVLATLK